MKKLKLILCLFIGVVCTNLAQTGIIILNKDELYKPPLDEMVVMDKYTFGNYHYTSEKYDTLKVEIKELDSIIRQQDNTQNQLIADYESSLQVKDLEVNTYKEGYKDVSVQLNSSIDKNNQLITDYKKLQEKNRRIKKWRNFFMGTTLLLGTIVTLTVIY